MTKKAFTLLETIVVIAIFIIVAAVAFPLSIGQSEDAKAEGILSQLNSDIFLQQQNAVSRKNNNSYGVFFDNNKYTMYTGSSLSSASDTFSVDLPSSVQLNQISLNNSGSEINFSSGSFRPSTYGTVKYKVLNDTYILDINSEGFFYYYKQ